MTTDCQSSNTYDQHQGLSPEERLLVLAARTALSPEDEKQMTEILRQGLNWSWIEASGKRLGVQSLMLKHFSHKEKAFYVPEAVMVRLEAAYRRQAIRSLRNEAQISRLLTALNQEKIPVILLKGAYLAAWVYEDRALRPMSDIDILVSEPHAGRVREILLNCGYEDMQIYAQSPFHREVLLHIKFPHLLPFLSSNGVRVEVHLDLFKKAPIKTGEMERVWERAVPVDLYGAAALALCPEHLMLHLAHHLRLHMMEGKSVLYWFYDLDLVVRRYGEGIHWDDIKSQAKAMGIASRIGTVFHLLVRHWGTPVPEEFLRNLSHGADMGPIFWDVLFNSKGNLRNFVPNKLRLTRKIQKEYGWGKYLYYVLRHFFPARSYILNKYHPQNRREIWGCYLMHFCNRFRSAFSSLFLMVMSSCRSFLRCSRLGR